MQVTIVALGKKMPDWIEKGVKEYSKRFTQEISINLKELSITRRNSATSTEKIKANDAEKIRAHIPGNSYTIALDEHGKTITSKELSKKLSTWMKEGDSPCFIIGGADGLDKGIINEAREVFSLSALTLPHAMVRVLLLEQLYRAWSILNNHPYHRE
jgi:23S rRNA (pseudouridine1915-N3)-methyltransferase